LKTEVHQVTQPLLDKEIRSVNIEQRVLPTQVLPEVTTRGGIAAQRDVSSVNYLDAQKITVEKPAIFTEVDKLQIIEEIQPVIYKETIVPTLIKETQPVFQKIVEGAVYTQQVLPPLQLHGSRFENVTVQHVGLQQQQNFGLQQNVVLQQQPMMNQAPLSQGFTHPKKVIEETTTTTTTTTGAPLNPRAF